jgi:hypothetical protein
VKPVLAAVLLAAAAHAEEPHAPRFLWREELGAGAWVASSAYTTGTRDLQAFTLSSVTTVGLYVAEQFTLSAQVNFHLSPALHESEDRSLGHKELAAPFALAGLLGPSLGFVLGRLWLDLTPGFLFVVAAEAPNGGIGPSFGGTGVGAGLGGGYHVPLFERLELSLGLRAIVGAHFNSDRTHLAGWDVSLALLAGLGSP